MSDARGRQQDGEPRAEQAEILPLLRRLVAAACGKAVEEIEADRPLVDYGLSSRDAVGISGELGEALGRDVPATLLWEHPTLNELVRHLDEDAPERTPPVAAAPPDVGDPVAVVGIGCRLPGGVRGPDAFWDFLLAEGDAVGQVPPERWRDCGEDIAAAAATLPRITRWGAYLEDIAGFDAQFFGITPREARLMDPQQRLLLEVSWEALDHAGLPAPTMQGSSTGVYVGLSALEYGFLTTDPARATEWTSTGSAGSIVANRVSYALDLRGPSLTVDTACSSSLVALHQACRDLRSGACDTALAGGVNVLLSPAITVGFHRAGVLAPGGRCRPFDAGAEGIVRGEGCGVVVLKRLADARREDLPILALIRGTAVNSDGRSAGLVAPNPVAQRALLRAALRDAAADERDIGYVEAHGTGTLLGDPIEATALSAALGRRRSADRPLLIGSVKSNIGHLEGAAGIASVIKTVLALRHGTLPATLHFKEPNPHIDFTAGHLRVVAEASPWPTDGQRPARAGVSAFGFGGTNAHAILEQWQPRPRDTVDDPGSPSVTPHILVLSARSADRLADAARGMSDWLAGPSGARTPLEDLTRTLGEHRYGTVCAAVVGRDRSAVREGLRALGDQRPARGVVSPQPSFGSGGRPGAGPVFVFSGYGTQWEGMGRRLLAEDAAFADAVRSLDPDFAAEAGGPLSRLIADGVPLADVARVQPLLFGMQVALVRTWRAYGVEPAAVIGHSMGEVAAAVAVGALDARDGLRVVLRRSALLGAVDRSKVGAMAAVELAGDERAEFLARFPGVQIAVDASPRRCTVTGPSAAVAGLLAELEDRGSPGRLLDVGGAGHSPAVEPILPELRSALAGLPHRPAALPWYGTVFEDPRQVPAADEDYWCGNARRPVRFRQAVAAAAADGYRVFLEISPHPVAGLPLRETLDDAVDDECLVVASLRRDSDEPLELRTSLAALHLAGLQHDFRLLWPTGRRTSLPPTQWRHKRHWVDGTTRRRVRPEEHPLLGARLDVPDTRRTMWRGDVGTGDRHRTDGQGSPVPLLTLATCAALVHAAATEIFAAEVDEIEVRDLALDRLLPLGNSTPLITMLDPAGPGRATVSIHTRSAAGRWRRLAAAGVRVDVPNARGTRTEPDPAAFAVEFTLPPAPDAPEVSAAPAAPGRFDAAMLDGCLRAPTSAPRATTADGRLVEIAPDAIPVALRTLRVNTASTAPGTCHGGPSPTGEHGSWSIRLEDADGAMTFDADGVVLRAPGSGETVPELDGAVYEIIWESTPLAVGRPAEPRDWLLLTVDRADGPAQEPAQEPTPETAQEPAPETAPDGNRATDLCASLESAGQRVTVRHCEPNAVRTAVSAWRRDVADGAASAIVLLRTDHPARDTVLTTTFVARELAAAEGPVSRLFMVTEHAATVTDEESGDPDQACLRGLVRVLALEQPYARPCLIDIDRSAEAGRHLADELLADGQDDEVAWRGGTRFAARLSRAELGARGAAVPFARPRGAYIVTGGLTGLGLATAQRLAEHGAGRLVLNGRRPPDDKARTVLRNLRDMGAEVEVVLGDIAESDTAPRLVRAAVDHGHALRGVVHAAGVLRDGTVSAVGPSALNAVFRPKVDGGRHLDTATAGHDLDWWVAFSSAAALFGSPGQAAYAAANAWLDALTRRRRSRGLPGQTIAWGPWAGTGAAPDMTGLALEPITPDEGLEALQLVIRTGRPYTGVVRLHPQRAAEAFPGIESVPFFSGLMGDAVVDTGGTCTVDELRGLDRDAALAAVRRLLVRRTATVMGFADQEVDTAVPLTQLGLDSLMAVRIRNAIKRDLGVTLPETLLLRGGTLDGVAAAVLAALDVHSGAPAPDDEGRTAPPLPGDILPRDAAERLVAGVWSQVSGQPSTGVHRELTAARDDPGTAARLKEGIQARLSGGRSPLTLEQIRANPTVAAMAESIRPAMEGSRADAPVRRLRDPGQRADRAPLFVFHPAGGPTSVYQPLTDLLARRQPVFGLDRVESLTTVEDKAEHYLDLMRGIQPHGPYRVLGWSFGGCLAYEVAALARKAGAHVGYVGLIDTILPAALPDVPHQELLLQRFERFAAYVETAYGRRLRLPYEEMAAMDEQNQVDTLMRHVAEAGLDMSPGVMEHQRTSYIDARIGERYRPGPCREPVVLYRAQEPQVLTTAIDPRYLRDDAHLGWGPLCPRLTVVPVPGDHLSLIDPPNVEFIADHLRAALDDHS